MDYFGESTKRIQKMRDTILGITPEVCVERAVYTTDVYKNMRDKPTILKRAHVLDKTLRNMTIFIEEGGLLAGNQASKNRSAPIFPEYAIDWIVAELDEWEKRDGDRFTITEENKQKIRDMAQFWKNNTVKDKGLSLMPPLSRLYYDIGIIKVEGNITAGDAHLAVDYDKVLRVGLAGVRDEALAAKEKLNCSNFDDLKKLYFYDAILMVIDACIAFAHRYSKLAADMAGNESDPVRKAELEEISRICANVPEKPATSFHEALQSVWFIHLILQIESSGHSLSYGRVDQFLYPYFKKDMDAGVVDETSACELMENFWIKTFSINKIRSNAHTKFSAGSPLYQNACIGGQTADGKDATNDLSFMILKSIAHLRLTQPNLSVRYHAGMSDAFLKECIEVVKLGFGMPSFNNDEIIIDSFISKGVSREDAMNYTSIGCIEVSIPGKFGYRCSGMNFMNLPKILMIALNDGVDVTTGKKVCDGYGHFTDMTSFEEVWEAYRKTLYHFTKHSVILDNSADLALEENVPDVLCSSLVDDCIGRGKHLKEGGAVYDFIGPLQVGIANIGDSMAAIKKLVFEEKKLTTHQLWDALMNDFEGAEFEKVRDMLINDAPKYGNDDNYVDELIVKAYELYMDEIQKYKNTRFGRGPIGGEYWASTSSISANVPQGSIVCATPDGRKNGEPLAEGCSPSHAYDVNGPTAVFKSISKLPTIRMTGGVLLNQKLTPQSLESESDVRKLMMIIRTFFNTLKGFHVQYNVVSKSTLIDAQQHPEKHRDLIVRVAGYSAFFNTLSTETQNDIIGRTEHTL